MNFLPCEVDGSFAVVDGHRIRIADHAPEIAGQSGDQWELGIRPEFLRLIFDKPTCGIEAEITQVEDLGSSRVATVEAGGRTLRVRLTEDQEIRGESGWLVFPPDRSLLYRNSKLVPASWAGQS
jgi:glycerol transport system ATP-binding protein